MANTSYSELWIPGAIPSIPFRADTNLKTLRDVDLVSLGHAYKVENAYLYYYNLWKSWNM